MLVVQEKIFKSGFMRRKSFDMSQFALDCVCPLPATLSYLKLGFTHGEKKKKKKDRSHINFPSSNLLLS